MKNELLCFACTAVFAGASCFAEFTIRNFEVDMFGARGAVKENVVDAPKSMKLILLMGQSNMAGRAKPRTPFENAPLPNAFKMNPDGKWVNASSPIHYDRKSAGTGPVEEFVRRYIADHPTEKVGIVPCAVGGSQLATWFASGEGKIGSNYRAAIARAKAARANGEFIAVLWHQGETDATNYDMKKLDEYYAREFSNMVKSLRKELGNDKLPFIIGEIGEFWGDKAKKINPVLNSLAESIPECEIVSAKGLKDFDKLHFDFKSVTELGRRYYEAYKTFVFSPDDGGKDYPIR